MPTRIPPEQVQNLQQIEVYVTGPDTANRLVTVSGQFDIGQTVYGQPNNYGQSTNTYSVLIGPVMTNRQFYKAIGTGAIIKIFSNQQTLPSGANWNINSIDADWDDESGQVELRMEVFVQAYGANNSVQAGGLNFQATILYAAAQ